MPLAATRRKFIRQLGLSATLLTTAGRRVAGKNEYAPSSFSAVKVIAPSDRIRVGVIGLGLMGFGDMETALKVPGVEIGGVCDLYSGHLERAGELWGNGLYTTPDYAELLARKDIDAVIIATPDHWHAKISIAAMKAGKHVYCEKPMVQQIGDGHDVINTQKETGKVFMVGSQGVSSVATLEARKLIKTGELGDINLIEAVHDSYSVMGAWNYSIPTDASQKTVNWDRFLGAAPRIPYDPVRFFRWRNYKDYGTGVAGDIYIHKISAIHHAVDSTGPASIYASGQLSFWKDGRDVPDVLAAIMNYPATSTHTPFQLQLRVNLADGSGGNSITRIVGSHGSLELKGNNFVLKKRKLSKAPGYGGWDGYNVFSAKQQKDFLKWYNEKYTVADQAKIPPIETKFTAPAGYDDRLDHFTFFFDAIRGGKAVVEDASYGLRAAGPVLACNLSHASKKIIQWDPDEIKIVN